MERSTQKTILEWHKDALLFNARGQNVGFEAVSQASKNRNSDDGNPLNVLPRFFDELAQGKMPCATPVKNSSIVGEIGDFLTLTGGTTGAPKIIHRSSESWLHSIKHNAPILGIGLGARVAVIGDLSYSLTFYAAVEALTLGAECHLLTQLGPKQTLEALKKREITHLYCTPAQLRFLPEQPISSLNAIIVGGGFMDKRVKSKAQVLSRTAGLFAFYGAAETSFITWSDADTVSGSVGRPYPDVEIVIRDAHGNGLSAEETGAIWVRSPMNMIGYANQGQSKVADADGYISTGENGRLDAQGYLYLTGRADRSINISDVLVDLDRVEQKLLELSTVENIAVFALPDDNQQNRTVVAALTDQAGIAKLKALAKESFDGPARPKHYLPLTVWPTKMSGKTDYSVLLEMFNKVKI